MRVNADLRNPWQPPGKQWDFISAFPPCTHLSVSGAAWFKGKGLRPLSDSIAMFATAAEICEEAGCPYIIENPISTISTYWREPDYMFHPWQFSLFCPDDTYTKKTCLWTGGGFVMPDPAFSPHIELDNRIHMASPSPERANFRSATPKGFALAVYNANASTEKQSSRHSCP